jgi:hypothetical protein
VIRTRGDRAGRARGSVHRRGRRCLVLIAPAPADDRSHPPSDAARHASSTEPVAAPQARYHDEQELTALGARWLPRGVASSAESEPPTDWLDEAEALRSVGRTGGDLPRRRSAGRSESRNTSVLLRSIAAMSGRFGTWASCGKRWVCSVW